MSCVTAMKQPVIARLVITLMAMNYPEEINGALWRYNYYFGPNGQFSQTGQQTKNALVVFAS